MASKAASEVFLRLKRVAPLCEVARRGKRGSTLRADSFSLPEKVAADLPIVEAVTEREIDGPSAVPGPQGNIAQLTVTNCQARRDQKLCGSPEPAMASRSAMPELGCSVGPGSSDASGRQSLARSWRAPSAISPSGSGTRRVVPGAPRRPGSVDRVLQRTSTNFTVTHRRVESVRKGPLSPEGRENYPSQQGCGLTG